MRSVSIVAVTLLSGWLIWSIGPAAAEEASADSAQADAQQQGEEAAEPARSRYDVPEGGVEELLVFIQDLQGYRPSNAQEFIQHRNKSQQAIQEAAEKILALETDESSDAYQTAKLVLLESRVGTIGRADREEQKQIIKEVAKALKAKAENGLTSADLNLAMTAARGLEYGGQPESAADAYEKFAKTFLDSGDEGLAGRAERMEGAARRLRLPGNFMELEGTAVDGSEFNWDDYRGKVVLVDFWATWCGPCRAEMPNVQKHYELYHDRGFDVVGISLDRSREALVNYLEEHQYPWVTLYDDEAGGAHPMATHYGVFGIPTVLLVDREGKVVSLNARGANLGRLLEEQLGPVDDPEEKADLSLRALDALQQVGQRLHEAQERLGNGQR